MKYNLKFTQTLTEDQITKVEEIIEGKLPIDQNIELLTNIDNDEVKMLLIRRKQEVELLRPITDKAILRTIRASINQVMAPNTKKGEDAVLEFVQALYCLAAVKGKPFFSVEQPTGYNLVAKANRLRNVLLNHKDGDAKKDELESIYSIKVIFDEAAQVYKTFIKDKHVL